MGDAFVCDLAEGIFPDVWGLVCVTAWNPEFEDPNISFQNEYEALRQYLRDVVLSFDEYCYIYPYNALHITVQTLLPFTRGLNLIKEEETRKKLGEEWKDALTQATKDSSCKRDTITVKDVELRGTAGIFLFNENETIKNLRDIIQKARDSAESHQGLVSVPFKLMKENIRPTIVHSTFIRFKKVPLNAQEIIQEINDAIQKYKNNSKSPLFSEKVKIEKLSMCEETIPYMHSTAESSSSPKILWEISLSDD